MWNTMLGCRVLTGAEAKFVCAAASRLVDEIRTSMPQEGDTGEKMEIGIGPFDRMTPEQQIVMIDRVIAFLIDPTLKDPPRSALLDAVVAAIYAQAFSDLENEVDSQQAASETEDGDTDWRKSIVEVLVETTNAAGGEALNPPDPECVVAETWEFAIDCLRDCVLVDEDWKMADQTLDLPPEASRDLKQTMGIAGDYFVVVPPEATRADARNAWADFIERVTAKRPPLWRFGDQEIHPVELSDLASEMDILPEEWSAFVNRKTGEIISLPSDVFDFLAFAVDGDMYFGDAPEEMLEVGRQINEGDHFVPLPRKFEIDEWSIMRKFCDTLESEDLRSQLLAAIHRSGAFRNFKSILQRLDLRDDWFRYRDQALERIAVLWLDDNEIPWVQKSRGDDV